MNLPDLTLALVSAMLSWTPATQHAWTGESGLDTIARYHHIARVSAQAALDEEPLPGLSHAQSAALLVAVGSMESGGWARDVQDCTRGGDGGKSWTVFGLWGSRAGVCDDLEIAAHVAISRLRDSMETCRGPAELSLTRYASGHCGQGRRESLAARTVGLRGRLVTLALFLFCHGAVTLILATRLRVERAARLVADDQARAAWAQAIQERAAREAAERALNEELVALRSHVVAQPFDSGPLP